MEIYLEIAKENGIKVDEFSGTFFGITVITALISPNQVRCTVTVRWKVPVL